MHLPGMTPLTELADLGEDRLRLGLDAVGQGLDVPAATRTGRPRSRRPSPRQSPAACAGRSARPSHSAGPAPRRGRSCAASSSHPEQLPGPRSRCGLCCCPAAGQSGLTPAVWVWNRSHWARSVVAPYSSRSQRAQIRRAARNLAISSKKSIWAAKKKESLSRELICGKSFPADDILHVFDTVSCGA